MTTILNTRQNQLISGITSQKINPAQIETQCESSIKLELYDFQHKESCLYLWEELDLILLNQRLTSSAPWVKNWLNVYGDTVQYEFALAKIDQAVCGIALIIHSHNLKNGFYKIRTTHLGTAGEPHGESVVIEYNSLLVDDRYRHKFINLLMERLSQRTDWDELHLDGFETAELEPFCLKLKSDCRIISQTHERESRYLNLSALRNQQQGNQHQGILEALGKSTKSNIKRKLKAYGEIKLEWADNHQTAISIFDELVSLHQARWQQQGLPGAFASNRFKQFQLTLILELLSKQKVVLFRASTQQETIGCLMLLVDQGRLLDYLSGFAPYVSGTSPGLITHYLCMQEALKRGFLAYDFLIGEKRHKENLGKDSTTITWYKAQRKTWKFRLQEFLRMIKHKFIKKSGISKTMKYLSNTQSNNNNESST